MIKKYNPGEDLYKQASFDPEALARAISIIAMEFDRSGLLPGQIMAVCSSICGSTLKEYLEERLIKPISTSAKGDGVTPILVSIAGLRTYLDLVASAATGGEAVSDYLEILQKGAEDSEAYIATTSTSTFQ